MTKPSQGSAALTSAIDSSESSLTLTPQGHRRKLQHHTRLVCWVLALLVAALFSVNVLLGSFTVTIPDFLAILGGKNIPGASFIVLETKLPRAVLGTLVGAVFGVSGLIFQTLLRNPLASPDVIGITSGASASAVIASVIFSVSGLGLSVAAILGAFVVAVAISVLSGQHMGKRDAGARVILIGIALAAIAQAIISLLLQRADINRAQEALVWLTGSLNSASWERIHYLLLGLLLLIPYMLWLMPRITVLQLGDDAASGLGVPVSSTKVGLIIVAVLLAALATAAAGPISFIALLAGAISQQLLHRRASLTAAALVGSSIVLAAEYLSANLLLVPVGVITGAAGAPFLLWLLIRGNGQRKNYG